MPSFLRYTAREGLGMMLSSLMDPTSIELGANVNTKKEALERLVGLAEQSGTVKNRRVVLEALIERESLCSTAVGRGVAIPHPKEPLPGALSGIALAVLRVTNGLDLDAPDNRPVTLFFLMGAEDRRSHLQILGKLARILKDDVVRDELMTADSPDAFVATFTRAEQSVNRANCP
jgi:mannitol/fructose-specific phosphotransferase system IIA component (Ntr-type)